jgi:hypothetical protein
VNLSPGSDVYTKVAFPFSQKEPDPMGKNRHNQTRASVDPLPLLDSL